MTSATLRETGEPLMAYREKTAWLTLACMAISYAAYFTLIAARATPPSLIDILWLFGVVAGSQAIVVILGSIVLAARTPSAARRPDERDKAIARRGASAGNYVMMIGIVIVGVVMPFSDPAPKIVNTALLAIVVAEAVRLLLVIASYRRGWHG